MPVPRTARAAPATRARRSSSRRRCALKKPRRIEPPPVEVLAGMRDLVPIEDRTGAEVRRANTIRAMCDLLRRKRQLQVRRSRWLGAIGAIAIVIVLYCGWKLEQ